MVETMEQFMSSGGPLRGRDEICRAQVDTLFPRHLHDFWNVAIRDKAIGAAACTGGLPHRDAGPVDADSFGYCRRATEGRDNAACRFHALYVAYFSYVRQPTM